MGFGNALVAGFTLVRQAIQSANYVAGISGWMVSRDGNAEFNDVTMRGELLVEDPDGSYVRVFDEDPGEGAVVLVNPADFVGHTITPGRIRSFSDDGGSTFSTYMDIEGPTYDALNASSIQLRTGGGVSSSSVISLSTDVLFLDAPTGVHIGSSSLDPLVTGARGDEAGNWFGPGSANTTTSSSFAAIPNGVVTGLYRPEPFSRLRVSMSMTATSSATATDCEFGLRIASDTAEFTTLDIGIGTIAFDATGVHVCATGHRQIADADISGGPFFGDITITPIWRRSAGAGTVTHGTRARGSYTVVDTGS